MKGVAMKGERAPYHIILGLLLLDWEGQCRYSVKGGEWML